MAAGIKYNVAPPVEREVCDESPIYRLNDGGMDLDKSNLPAKGWLPELCPLFRDKVERKAYACLRVKVVEAAAAAATSFKIQKNPFLSFLKAGFLLSDGTNVIEVASVDTSNEAYDVVNVANEGYTIPGEPTTIPAEEEGGEPTVVPGEDTVVPAGLPAALAKGAILAEAAAANDASAKHTANFASFGWRNIENEDSVTFVGRVFGILEEELYIPFTDADKAALGDRFMFI